MNTFSLFGLALVSVAMLAGVVSAWREGLRYHLDGPVSPAMLHAPDGPAPGAPSNPPLGTPLRGPWRPGSGVDERSGEHDLTMTIANIEADPDTPDLLSGREREAIEEAAYAAMFDHYDVEIGAALQLFEDALEPVRQTLKAWHGDGYRFCTACPH